MQPTLGAGTASSGASRAQGQRQSGPAGPPVEAPCVPEPAPLSRFLDNQVIPRVVRHHGPAPQMGVVHEEDVQLLVDQLLADRGAEVQALIYRLRQRGVSVATIYQGLLSPAAALLGNYWVDDRTDFATVTWAVGRLQALMRGLGPAFAAEMPAPAGSRRILFAQAPEEQHGFGLSMLAEFFRQHGWHVLGGPGGSVDDPAAWVRREALDAVGFSVGSEVLLIWVERAIQQVRAAAGSRPLFVLVGGPIFIATPALAQQVGADGTAADAPAALALLDQWVPERRSAT